MFVLSGDNDSEKENLTKIFNKEENLLFNQSPVDKKKFIEKLQSEKNKVFMLGDGLNDVGALSQANIGVSVADNVLNFTPSSDGILKAEELKKLKKFICFARRSLTLITISFIISFIYNAVGITVAVQGLLSPLFAAILMPLSSISVVIFATVSTSLLAKKYKLL
jgi:Cu+-exporting ATPase